MARFLKALILIIIFLVGVALIVLPFVYNMPDRTKAADEMMEAFTPIVNTEHAQQLTADVVLLQDMAEDTQKLLPELGQRLGMTEEQLNAMLSRDYPDLATGMQKMEEMLGRLSGDTQVITEQIDNFASAKELPIRWTPWLFVILGAAIVLLLLLRLLLWRPSRRDKKVEPAKPAEPSASAS
jgi:ElaB/YqjD/DUF883 family membrane-anchored ribosome-binding protein